MPAFIAFSVFSLFLTHHVANSIKPSLKKSYIIFALLILFLGLGSVSIYTMDNLMHGQIGMPGDSQYYLNGALSLIKTGRTQTFYPNYERFLALFLYLGNPFVARMAQVLLFLCMYALTVKAFDWLNISRIGLVYFSAFTAGIGIYYGAFVKFTRDSLIISIYSFIYFILVWYYKREEKYRRLPVVSFLGFSLLLGLSLFYLRSLGNIYIFPVIAGLTVESLVFGFKNEHKLLNRSSVALILIVLIAVFFSTGGFQTVAHFWQVNVKQGVLLQKEEKRLGVQRSRSVLDPFKALLGPGLIRPLLPQKYFIVWIPSFAAFYWWGMVFWYGNLIISTPILLKWPVVFVNKRTAIFTLVLFLSLVGGYTLVYISGMGMRKRVMFHFLYTIFITTTFFTQANDSEGKRMTSLKLPFSTPIFRLLVAVMLFVTLILSIQRVPNIF